MNVKNKLMIAAVAGIFSVTAAEAQDASEKSNLPRDTTVITVPPGQTTVEISPGATAVEVSPAPSATVVSEPAGASSTTESPGWNMKERFTYDKEDDRLYPDREFTIDLFGAFTDNKKKFNDAFDTTLRNGKWGAGVGLNYFFARNVGIGVDAFGIDNGSDLVDAVNGSLILRLPIDVAHLAPYIFGGGGRQFEGSDTWTLHGGVGLELRMNRHTGLFVDGRYVWPEKKIQSEYVLLRAGVRIAF